MDSPFRKLSATSAFKNEETSMKIVVLSIVVSILNSAEHGKTWLTCLVSSILQIIINVSWPGAWSQFCTISHIWSKATPAAAAGQHGAQFNIPLYRSKGFTAFEEEIE